MFRPSFALFCSLIFTSIALAAPLPTASSGEGQLMGMIQSLSSDSPTLDQQQQQQLYEESLNLLREGDGFRQQAKQYRDIIHNFDRLKQQAQQQLEQADNLPPLDEQLDPRSLNQQFQINQEQLLALKQRQQQVRDEQRRLDSDVSQLYDRSQPLREQLNELRGQLDALQFSVLNDVDEAKRVKAQVNEAKLTSQLAMLELAAQSAPLRNELLQLELALLQRQQANLEANQQTLQQRLQLSIEADNLALTQRAIELDEALASHPLGESLLGLNRQLRKQLDALIEQSFELQQSQQTVSQQLNQISYTFANFKEQVSWLKVTRAYGEYLREQIAGLPDPYPMRGLEQQIIETRVSKHRFQQQQYSWRFEGMDQEIEQWRNQLPLDQAQQVRQLQTFNQQLANNYQRELDLHLFTLASLKLDYTRLNDELEQIRIAANQELFWTADVKAIDASFFVGLQQAVVWLLQPQHMLSLSKSVMNINVWWWLGAVLSLVVWGYQHYLKRTWLKDYLQRSDAKTRNITKDKFSLTLANLLLCVFLSAPMPVLMLSIGNGLLQSWEEAFVRDFGDSLVFLAKSLFLFQLLRHICFKHGLLNTHFKWPLVNVQQVYHELYRLALAALPLLFLFFLSYSQSSHPAYSSLARLIFILLMLWLASSWYRISRLELPVNYHVDIFKAPQLAKRLFWYGAMAIPLVGAVAACVGYFSTAYTIVWQFCVSVLIGSAFIMVYLMVRRWMWLQRRRIAFERAKAKRIEKIAQRNQQEDEQQSSAEGQLDNIEEPEIDLDTISAQSLGLLRTALFVAFFGVLAVLWSEMTNAFSVLDNVTLWEISSVRSGVETLQAITLRGALMAIITLGLTMILVRNLPGLLELMLLQHLSLSPGTGFAITTTINYLVILFGALTGFGLLGIEWSKLQWLVAALTVGLGFGLQEIFANFISGLIILFEKPIRIGDTVTIRELTGTISKIETRATTILDWDRKEIIVPNKAFITEQFINWSLTDPITRVVLSVPVKQGSDINQVTRLITEAVEESSLVLDNPAPEIYFLGYTDHGPNFEMRVYVSEMAYRLPMTHEVFSLINDKFKASGIEIAYPQLDVSLNTSKEKRFSKSMASRHNFTRT
ncbi:miniconductance mechanosensitive channel MscM [Aliagarivorans taiwanensis]|uniref:miniconductance mechanosensitive channel MscM n=1 Tax=Aliagarivorans taiwanensis TaxID=561966 RepID=UPI0003F75BAF|nr:miniconductance mechanosensitive channel MscM [Aliagarivorans taiwanensis]